VKDLNRLAAAVLAAIPVEKRLRGVPAEERLRGVPAEELLQAWLAASSDRELGRDENRQAEDAACPNGAPRRITDFPAVMLRSLRGAD
jgi:hypothetical protein